MFKCTYECQFCTNQIVSLIKPENSCEVCGQNNWHKLDKTLNNQGNEIMAINKDIFSSAKFRSTIESYCRENDWSLDHIDSDQAILKFNMESGSQQILIILRFDTMLEISCPSGLKFSDEEDIPHRLSTTLLQQNSQSKIGFWCIDQFFGKQVFSIMHNVEISLIDAKYFTKVVLFLVSSCDEFEQRIESILKRTL